MSAIDQQQTPIYVVSKGRADCQRTSDFLAAMGRKHFVVVEPQEVKAYRANLRPEATVLELDLSYKERYDTCDDRGLTASTGPGPARNFAWDNAQAAGYAWHWVMDDNINGFYRFNRNLKVPCQSAAIFDAMQDFCERFEDVVMAGPQYFMFLPRKSKHPPFIFNTRIYSCNLIRCDAPFRWRARYNEDTDLSLRMLKAGFSTIQFNAFLQYKMATQALKGGNTGEFYAKEGTWLKSKMLEDLHPDVARVADRFSRIHHVVDYSSFQARKPKLKSEWQNCELPPNEYGMRLQKRVNGKWYDVTKRDYEAKYAPSITLEEIGGNNEVCKRR